MCVCVPGFEVWIQLEIFHKTKVKYWPFSSWVSWHQWWTAIRVGRSAAIFSQPRWFYARVSDLVPHLTGIWNMKQIRKFPKICGRNLEQSQKIRKRFGEIRKKNTKNVQMRGIPRNSGKISEKPTRFLSDHQKVVSVAAAARLPRRSSPRHGLQWWQHPRAHLGCDSGFANGVSPRWIPWGNHQPNSGKAMGKAVCRSKTDSTQWSGILAVHMRILSVIFHGP